MKIDELIRNIQLEINKTQKTKDNVAKLTRLHDIMRVYNGDDKLVSFEEIGEKLRNQPEDTKLMTGWNGFDDLLGGFRLKQVVAVSALTKSGKTSWLMDLTTRWKEHNPLWFPYEEGAEELMQKFIERNEPVPHGYAPIYAKGGQMEWIEMKIVESIAKYGTQVVFIDQLDFIVPLGGDNHSLRVGQAMRELKGLAKKWNVLIFIICHLVKAKMDVQPTLEDLKGSSSIGQEADTVILLWREMGRENGQVNITNNVNISVQANRRTGKTGNIKMVYDNGHFLEKEWKNYKDESLDNYVEDILTAERKPR